MLTPEQFRRVTQLTGLATETARGTAFYQRLKDGRETTAKMQRRPLYQLMPLYKRVFLMQAETDTYQQFLKWANEPITKRDRLNGKVAAFTNKYGEVDVRHYLLTTKVAVELYTNNYMNHQGTTDRPAKPSILDTFQKGD